MYAIIETGGKQYRVAEGTELRVECLDAEVGGEVALDKVLFVGGAKQVVGTPYVDNAKVVAEVVDHGRGKKIMVFKKLRRKDSRRMQGHRQDFTTLKIKSITA